MREKKEKRVVIKVGGSLMDKGRAIMHFLRNYAEEKGKSVIVIIPGGGPFADTVRKFSGDISEETAHWMAILAMHQYGLYLANGEIPLVESVDEIEYVGGTCILLPYEILKEEDSLPRTWDVTSDTIAAFVAKKLGEKYFIKLTDIDGILKVKGEYHSLIKEIKAKDMIENFCVDTELPKFLIKEKMKCIIVNGNFPERIKDAIEGKETICTKILY